jgi:hypothetical protein
VSPFDGTVEVMVLFGTKARSCAAASAADVRDSRAGEPI